MGLSSTFDPSSAQWQRAHRCVVVQDTIPKILRFDHLKHFWKFSYNSSMQSARINGEYGKLRTLETFFTLYF
jgi:hypothetical protein